MPANGPYRHIEVERLGPTFAARVTNVDLSEDLSEAVWEEIRHACLDERVLAFRGQDLAPAHIVEASRRFGYCETHIDGDYLLEGHPEIIKIGNLKVDGVMRSLFVNAREEWHFDYSYVAEPSIGALFYAVEVPPEGGDTLFADSTAAFEALPESEKDRLRPLVAVHSWQQLHRDLEAMDPDRKPLSQEAKARYPDVAQPLVYRHPETGRESLWLCPAVIVGIEGMGRSEARTLLGDLQEHVTSPAFRYDHKWEKGDLVVWDNRSVLHTATVFDYEKYLRLLYRTTILASAPAEAA